MHLFHALAVTRILTRNFAVGSEISFGTVWWYTYAGISCVLVIFAGIMSGLTLGLMSLGLVDLEILQRSGTSSEKKQAAAIFPVVQKQHQLLVTLLLCNACAMEALPIYLDKLFNQFLAIILSVTFVLAFGEVIPQAICTRYGLAVGANFVWLVRILMIICYPIAYPIGKVHRLLVLINSRKLKQHLHLLQLTRRVVTRPSRKALPKVRLVVDNDKFLLRDEVENDYEVGNELESLTSTEFSGPSFGKKRSEHVMGSYLEPSIPTEYSGHALDRDKTVPDDGRCAASYDVGNKYDVGNDFGPAISREHPENLSSEVRRVADDVLDWVLGHNEPLFRRAQLKALVSIHSQEAGKGGELTHDETTIISGALDLTEKTAEEAMTPIESTFSLDVNSKLDWEAMGKILARGHSRVPVYSGNPKNIIGLLLVKSLLTVRAETETPVSAVSIRRMPRVPADMPLYDILNEFQKGSSHMAAVVKSKGRSKNPSTIIDGEKLIENKAVVADSQLTTPLLSKQDEKFENFVVVDIEKASKSKPSAKHNDFSTNGLARYSDDIQDGEVIGIITLEDVFEELLQEEIVDETDEFVDVHKRIRVAAAAAASSMARAPSVRRITGQKGAGGHSKQGHTPKKLNEDDPNSPRLQGNPGEPLLGSRR